MSPPRPFTSFVREHRPLFAELSSLLSEVDREFRRAATSEQLEAFAQNVRAQIAACKPPAPTLGGARAARVDAGPYRRRNVDGTFDFVAHHYFAVKVDGDPTLLECWPDDDAGLEPVDTIRSDAFLDVDETEWQVRLFTEEQGARSLALYTRFDLAPEEEAAAAKGDIDITALFATRYQRIVPIVDRIGSDIDRYFDEILPTQLDDGLIHRREILSAREAVSQSFAFPDVWTYAPPVLEGDERQLPVRATDKPVPPVLPAPVELHVPHQARLSPASFERLQRTIRVWADAIERYPRSFAQLGEDRISDLLAATLKATLPAADREVFSRKGKSDILVRADVLSDGAAPEVVFIAESKWAKSTKLVQDALDPQLRGYLTVQDTSAVLLLLLPQQGKIRAIKKRHDDLRAVPGFVSEKPSAVEGWPVFVYRFDGRELEVCIATVHCP